MARSGGLRARLLVLVRALQVHAEVGSVTREDTESRDRRTGLRLRRSEPLFLG
jgi:hypothetical protein